jgi:hypothetical protein
VVVTTTEGRPEEVSVPEQAARKSAATSSVPIGISLVLNLLHIMRMVLIIR